MYPCINTFNTIKLKALFRFRALHKLYLFSFRVTDYECSAETVEQGNKVKYKVTNIVLYVDTLTFRNGTYIVFNEIRILLGNQSKS